MLQYSVHESKLKITYISFVQGASTRICCKIYCMEYSWICFRPPLVNRFKIKWMAMLKKTHLFPTQAEILISTVETQKYWSGNVTPTTNTNSESGLNILLFWCHSLVLSSLRFDQVCQVSTLTQVWTQSLIEDWKKHKYTWQLPWFA